MDGQNETRPEAKAASPKTQETTAMAKKTALMMVAFALLATSGGGPAGAVEEPTITLPTKTVTTIAESVSTEVTTTEIINEIEVGMWYVIRSTVPLFVLDAPRGSFSIVSGPSTVDGVFAGGDGGPETKVFGTDQSTYLIQGLKPCTAELILIPQGVTDRMSIERHMLTVTGPQPPPDDDDDPPEDDPEDDPEDEDDPPEDDPVVVESFRVIFVKESSATLNPAQTAIPAAKVIRDYLNAETTVDNDVAGWREYDPDQDAVNDEPTMRALWEAVQGKLLPAPCLVIEVNGHATVMPFPADVDECMETLRKFNGEQNDQ